MKIQRFSTWILATVVSFSLQAISVGSESASVQWKSNTPSAPSGGDVRWKAPKATVEASDEKSSEVVTAQHVDVSKPTIILVQHNQPMTPAQRDLIFPERRPQSITPPSGATNRPLNPSPSSMPVRREEPQRQAESSSSQSSTSSSGSPQRVTSNEPLPQPTNEAAAMKDPALDDQRLTAPSPLPAPTQRDTFSASQRGGVRIPCPKDSGFKSIKEISYDIRPMPGELPEECPLVTAPYAGRHFSQTCFQWKASAVCTKGAYFEDVQLERYGHTINPYLEPVISGARFFLTVPMLPYKMGLIPPNECVYTLGHYRVGNCAPYMLDPFPISVRAVLFEAAAVGAAVAFIP